MPRINRCVPPGYAHHVLNRGNKRAVVFREDGDYRAFIDLMAEASIRVPVKVLDYCLMPSHFHFVIWPDDAAALSAYMRALMNLHVRRYHKWYGTTGQGHIWQGRFKNFIIQDEAHLLRVLRYVHANPVRSCLVERAERWRWSGLTRPVASDGTPVLSPWPVGRPADWLDLVNVGLPDEELRAVRHSVVRGTPLGDVDWVERIAAGWNLEFTLRSPGRPRRPRDGVPPLR